MRAITIQQPWPWAVLNGHLDYLMEPFAPKARGYFLIHAGLGWNWELESWLMENIDQPIPPGLPQGRIVAYAKLIGMRAKPEYGPMAHGRMIFRITDITEIPHVVMVGRRGLWPVPRQLQPQIVIPAHVRLKLLSYPGDET